MTKDQIRAIFLGAGFTIKEGQTDLRPYVYDAAYALLSASIADTAEPLPVYQRAVGLDEQWVNTTKAEYENTPAHRRQKLYMRPVAAQSIADTAGAKPIGEVAASTGAIGGGVLVWFTKVDELPIGTRFYAATPAPSVADASGASVRIAQLESALSTALAFIDDATIEEGQWHWLDDVRAAIAKESGK